MNITQASKRVKRDMVIDYLKSNSRAPIMQIARDLCIPKSTVFDYLKEIKEKYKFTISEKA